MPEVGDYDNQKDWMAACVPERIDEGEEQEGAEPQVDGIDKRHGST